MLNWNTFDVNLFLMSLIFLTTGIAHFIWPRLFVGVIPDFLPGRFAAVIITGVLEVFFALAIWLPAYQLLSGWAMVGMLIMFLGLHVYHLVLAIQGRAVPGLPKLPVWAFWARVILQFPLMYWVYISLCAFAV